MKKKQFPFTYRSIAILKRLLLFSPPFYVFLAAGVAAAATAEKVMFLFPANHGGFFTCFVKKDDGKEKKDVLCWLDGLAGLQLLLFVRVLYFYVYALGGILLLCIGEGVVSCVTLERYHLSC